MITLYGDSRPILIADSRTEKYDENLRIWKAEKNVNRF